MMAQIAESKWKSLQYTADYKGEDFTASITAGNPDLLSWNGMGILHYLQSVTPKLALGAELAYQAAPQIPGNNYIMALIFQYNDILPQVDKSACCQCVAATRRQTSPSLPPCPTPAPFTPAITRSAPLT